MQLFLVNQDLLFISRKRLCGAQHIGRVCMIYWMWSHNFKASFLLGWAEGRHFVNSSILFLVEKYDQRCTSNIDRLKCRGG